jgi:hypothetical protein
MKRFMGNEVCQVDYELGLSMESLFVEITFSQTSFAIVSCNSSMIALKI